MIIVNVKTTIFQAIQSSISTLFRSIWPIDRSLSSATTPGQSWPWSDGNKGVLRIPQSSSITETSSPDCLVLYPGHSLWRGVLPLCRDAAGVFCRHIQLGQVFAGRLTLNCVCVVAHPRILLMSSSVHCSVVPSLCFLRLTWRVWEMGSKRPDSRCFQNLFKTHAVRLKLNYPSHTHTRTHTHIYIYIYIYIYT